MTVTSASGKTGSTTADRAAIDRGDFAFLRHNAEVGKALDPVYFGHLAQPLGILNYIRIANDMADALPRGRLLDWGCGLGQMTYLMRRRGFDVTPFDLGEDEASEGESGGGTVATGDPTETRDSTAVGPSDHERTSPDQGIELPITRDIQVVRTSHPTKLPFDDGAFDAVLSCGVLEHVDEYSGVPGNERRSLLELHRVLRPGGSFFIYQLPQKLAWQEAFIRRFHLGYSHPRRYTAGEIRALLGEAGFEVVRLRRANMVPKNLTGMPAAVRRLYNRWPRLLLAVDGVLSAIPGLNELAGVTEIWARRRA